MLACIMSICGFAQNNEPKLNESDEHIIQLPPDALYKAGLYMEKRENNTFAFKYYFEAAEQGYVNAESKVGYCYENGIGVEKDVVKAFKWYSKAATQGYAQGECKVGYCYENGIGVKKDVIRAFDWYSKAAAQGYAQGECNVGNCYENGIGVKKDVVKAFDWYSKAAAQGYAQGECRVGYCYENGIGVEKDVVKAFDWYSKAAAQGYAQGECSVGYCYEEGIGVEKDAVKAFDWYSKAATQGNVQAEYKLAVYYEKWNWRKARKWMNKAAEDGSLDAQIESANKYIRDEFSKIGEMQKGMVMKYILLACKQGHEKSKKMFEGYIGMPYENLGDMYRSKIKTYTGGYSIDAPSWYESGNCTYQYYEIGGLRIYHGVFEFRSNKVYRTKAGQAIPMLTIKGYFKDDFRDGTWKIRSYIYGSGIEEIDVTYQDGVFNGPITYIYKDKDKSNVTKAQINAKYKDGFIVGTYTARILDTFIQTSMDEKGLLHGKLFYEEKGKKIITGDFIHGTTNNCFTKNLQTGSLERYTRASNLITIPWTKDDSIMWSLTKRFRRGVGYIPINAADDEF